MREKFSILKVIAATCVVLVFSCALISVPKPARAQTVVGLDAADTLSIPIKSYTDAAAKAAHTGFSVGGFPVPFTSLDSIMKLAAKQILNQLNGMILTWINTGNNGGPLFIVNLNGYLNQTRSQSGAQFLMDNQGNFCGYFSGQLSEGLATEFQIDSANSGASGQCDFEKNYNVDAFFSGNSDSFSQGGGLDAWISLTQSQNNNPMGAWLSQRDALSQKIESDRDNAQEEADWGDGFSSQKDENGQTVTPGKAASDQLSFVLTSDQRQLELAKNFDDIITTFTNSLMTTVVNGVNQRINNTVNGAVNSVNNSINNTVNGAVNSVNNGINNAIGNGAQFGVASLNQYTAPDTSSQHLAFPGTDNSTTNSGTAKNVALNGTPTGSTPVDAHSFMLGLTSSASNCFDTDHCGYVSTAQVSNPHWEVDLNSIMPITQIKVSALNGYTLNDVYICIFSLSDLANHPHNCDATTATNSKQWVSQHYSQTNGFSQIVIKKSDLPDGITGEWVRIQGKPYTNLAFQNVEVYADSVPQIFLTGETSMTIPLNSTFSDPGWTAIDSNDGYLTNKVQVTGTVDTATAGTYILTYSVVNSAGVSNMIGLDRPVKRTVIVE